MIYAIIGSLLIISLTITESILASFNITSLLCYVIPHVHMFLTNLKVSWILCQDRKTFTIVLECQEEYVASEKGEALRYKY